MPLDQTARFFPSACPHDCPSTCALEVERLPEGRIGKVRGARDNDYTLGVICAKVARYAERANHPDRLTKPLIRVGPKGEGISAFREASWEEALDLTAKRLLEVEAEHGSEAIWPYFYAGTMGLVQRDGIQRLRHAKRYSRQHETICIALSDAGWLAGAGHKHGIDSREMAKSEIIVIWGGNPVNTQVNVMTHIARARKTQGAKLVVIDPYRTGTAQQADRHLMLRPGTDGALAAAVIHVLLREGLADREYLARYTDWSEEVEAHFRAMTPAWAAEITGLGVEEIEAFARLYGSTKRTFLRLGYGFTRLRNGSANIHAASCLPAVTGAWQVEGGGALYSQGGLYPLDRTTIMGLDIEDKSTRKLDMSRLGPILTGEGAEMAKGPPVMALVIQNSNPMVVCPDSSSVRRGFAREDLFVCVHEQFMTETAAMADVVLPATMFTEHDDVYIASAHTYLQVTRAVVDPPGECRSNHWVLSGLAKRLGAEHPGFHMSEWQLIDEMLKVSGLPDAETVYRNRWHDCALDFRAMHFLDGFGTPDGRFHFQPDWRRVGLAHEAMPRFPGFFDVIDKASEERPFRLVAAPARNYLNTSFTETPSSQKREARPTVLIHPDALAQLGLEDGERLRLGNAQGSVVVHAKAFDGLQRDVIVVESIWPNSAFEEGRGINTLTSAEAGPPRGGAVFHDTAVWVRAA